MLAYMKSGYSDLIAQINESGDYNDDVSAAMKSALEDFKTKGVY